MIPGIRVASGKAIEFERGFTELDKQLPLRFACDHRQSWLLVQEALILSILLILCIDVQYSCSRQAMIFSCFTLV